jgi:uncharacterized protein DUF4386
MNAAITVERFAEISPRLKARIAGAFNLLAIMMGIFASFVVHGRLSFVAELVAGACNVAVTLLLYGILSPVSCKRWHSLMSLGLHGTVYSISLVFFGFHCLFIGYLIARSDFLARFFGPLLAIAGLYYLINGFANFLAPSFAAHLYPYILFPGLSEVLLALARRDRRERETLAPTGQRSAGTPVSAAVDNGYGPPDVVLVADVSPTPFHRFESLQYLRPPFVYNNR